MSWTARYVQEVLLAAYAQHTKLPGGGISARPSMHLATATLAALTIPPRLGLAVRRRDLRWVSADRVALLARRDVGIAAALALWAGAGPLVESVDTHGRRYRSDRSI